MGSGNTHSIDWSDLQRCDLQCVNTKFHRTEEVGRAYENHKRSLAARKISLEDYVRMTALGNRPYVLTPNLFRYDVPPNIRHFVFWMQPGTRITMEQAKKIVSRDLGSHPCNIVVFENHPNQKSMPELPHYQVFIDVEFNKIAV